ncbi:Riddle 4 [Operophtera brumata]|uniref:Riddle 4 n=1 Tax=Operophtera brumata TaxID=104452 RepID=A0A0L7KZ68_OPEBR|nr:Riddle 4 [Operophtera brumata]
MPQTKTLFSACYWPHELYEPCFGGCAEVSCDNPQNHLRPCYPYCEPGCVCEAPYVRDDRTHQCVLPQDCTPTASQGACAKRPTCATIARISACCRRTALREYLHHNCYPYCKPGCVCEAPYVRDDRTHQCVLPQDCTPTQMGIPVTSKRADRPPSLSARYAARPPRPQTKREEMPPEFLETDMGSHQQLMSAGPPNNKMEEYKRPSEVSRMGNYFNIVIAPPPIKTLQPRKMLNNGYGSPLKRLS